MPRLTGGMFTVSRDSRVSSHTSVVRKLPTDRGKLTKESGFESNPNSPRAESALESGQPQAVSLSGSGGQPVALKDFNYIKKLGSGGYGSVVLVQKTGGADHEALYALKITSLNRAALVERDILPRLQNVPYTLDLAYAFYDSKLGHAYLVLPYAVGTDLFALAGPSTNGKKLGYLRRMYNYDYIKYLHRVRIVLAELCVAISHLHKLKILYRDLKLENILVFGDGHIRLADFGLSKVFEEGESTHITGKTGTPDYMAPEVLRSSGSHGFVTTYSFEADLWGLGVIAYELIVGHLPFRGSEVSDLESSIRLGDVEVPRAFIKIKYNRLERRKKPLVLAALSFVKAMLQIAPENRLSNDEIPRHIFFQDLDFEKIAMGHHDDPPFDIRRIRRDNEDAKRDLLQAAKPFTSASPRKLLETVKNQVPDKNGYDRPAKYVNYPYVRQTSGWYFSTLEGSQCEDSLAVLPENVGYEDEGIFDSVRDSSYIAIEDVPGLLDYEANTTEEIPQDSEDLIHIAPDDGDDTTAEDGPEDAPISSSPMSVDSVIDEDDVESDAESSLPPMASSTPLKDEIELFPRVRVVPADSAVTPYSLASARPRLMPTLLEIPCAKRKLDFDCTPAEAQSCDGRPTPTSPWSSRRQLCQDVIDAFASSERQLARDRHDGTRAAASPSARPPRARLAFEVPSVPVLSPVNQSCTPSRFERDSPLSPSPAKKTPIRHPVIKLSSAQVLSPVNQSCTPSRFERDSPLSPTPSPGRLNVPPSSPYSGQSSVLSQRTTAASDVSPTPSEAASLTSNASTRFVRALTTSDISVVRSEGSAIVSDVSTCPDAALETSEASTTCLDGTCNIVDTSARSDEGLEASGVSRTPVGNSPPASFRKQSWVSPSPPRPRRRRAAPAIPSPDLPPKKRRRFRPPSPPPPPSPAPELPELSRDGPRVIVQITGQPLPPFSSLCPPQERQLRSRAHRRRVGQRP